MIALYLSVNLSNWTLVWSAQGGTQHSEFILLQTIGQMVKDHVYWNKLLGGSC